MNDAIKFISAQEAKKKIVVSKKIVGVLIVPASRIFVNKSHSPR